MKTNTLARKILVPLMLACCLLPPPLQAASDADMQALFKLSLEEVLQVKVSVASTREESITDTPAVVSRYGRAGIFSLPGNTDGFVTESSYGYRTRVVAEYNDAFMGINLTPVLAFSHDVKGYAPQPGGAFVEGQQSLGFTLNADYQSTYNASLSYTQFMGGDYSVISDRDFASVSVGMQF